MSGVAPIRPLTVSDYLEAERVSETKHVLWDGDVFAMAGASPTHNLLVAAILGELRARLLGGPCAPYASDQRIRLPHTDRYVYPDASVICRPVELDPNDDATITNPRLVVEVLSDSTEAFDRGEKFVGYRSVPSLGDYLLVSQNEPRIEHYARRTDGSWVLRTYGAGSTVPIAALDIALPIDTLYAGVLDAA